MNASGEQDVLHLDTFNRIPLIKERVLGSQGGGRLELIVPLKLKGRSEGCSQSQDTRSAVIG